MAGYYIKRSNRDFGPFTPDAIREMHARGGIDPTTPISTDKTTWKRINDFPELLGIAPPPMPAPAPQPIPAPAPAPSRQPVPQAPVNPNPYPNPSANAPVPPAYPPNYPPRPTAPRYGALESLLNGKLKIRFTLSWICFAFWSLLKVVAAILFFVAILSDDMHEKSDNYGAATSILWLTGLFTLGVMSVFVVMFFHGIWSSIPKEKARVVPDVAVGLLFAPIWNVYWIFVVLSDAARGLNEGLSSCGLLGVRANKVSVGVSISTAVFMILYGILSVVFYALVFWASPSLTFAPDEVVRTTVIEIVVTWAVSFVIQVIAYSLLISGMAQMKRAACALNEYNKQ